ncbi:MAG: IS21 family transposase [Bdellovibrionota bacterium]
MKSKKMIDQIRTLHQKGYPIKKIANSLEVSKNTVRKYIRSITQQEEDHVGAEFTRIKNNSAAWQKEYDWDEIVKKKATGKTSKQLFNEYQPPVAYMSFARIIKQRLEKGLAPSLRLIHSPGEKTQVDFSTGIYIVDRKTGKQTKTHLFCAVLPFSSYTFATFVLDQKLESFIRCHEKMWAFFGGVTPYVVLDNLKSGVNKAHRYDPELNETYCDYANHAGFAGLPARPYKPKDKAAVESTIGVLKKTFYQEVSDEVFYSLADLNERLHAFLKKFNRQIMKNYNVSRYDRFQNEKELLKPVNTENYEIAEWKRAKVHPDCCIQIDKNFYSVPFKYCGQFVRVKYTKNIIEIYSQDTTVICCHSRTYGVGKISIVDSHLPDKKIQLDRYEIQNSIILAAKIGENLHNLVKKQFDDSYPLRRLRRVQGILRFCKTEASPAAIEYAAGQALTFNKYTLSFFKNCAKYFDAGGQRLKVCAPIRDVNTLHLHEKS